MIGESPEGYAISATWRVTPAIIPGLAATINRRLAFSADWIIVVE
jgi:hypothetical protein